MINKKKELVHVPKKRKGLKGCYGPKQITRMNERGVLTETGLRREWGKAQLVSQIARVSVLFSFWELGFVRTQRRAVHHFSSSFIFIL